MRVRIKTIFACLAALLFLCLAVFRIAGKDSYGQETRIPDDRMAVQAAAALEGRYVCLTFDDGPSKNTAAILEILARYQAPATFFVTAQPANEPYYDQLPLIQAGGHQIALHSASHRYSEIYQSTTDFWLDIKQLRQVLSAYVEVEDIHWLRFPGGSTNTVSHRYGAAASCRTLSPRRKKKATTGSTGTSAGRMATSAHPDADAILYNVQQGAEGGMSVWFCCTIRLRLPRR